MVATPGAPDLVPERAQLGPGFGEPARPRRRRLALVRGRSSHPLDLDRECALALVCGRSGRDRVGARLGRGLVLRHRRAVGRLGLGEQLGDPQTLRHDPLARIADDVAVEPSRSAIQRAWDVPGRPRASR